MTVFQKIKSWFSFDRPAHLLAFFVFISGVIWVIQTSLLQNILPLDAVEAVVWGNQMQWGQMKSPPLSGWMAAAAWHLSGGGDWALYLLAELMVLLGLWFVYKLAREFMDEYESSIATLLLCFILYYNPPQMKFCSHDTLLALLPAMALYFVRAFKNDRVTDWLLLAVFSALGVLGKYAAAQLLIAFVVIILATKDGRKCLRSYKPYLSAGVFFLLLAPHIYWLSQHDFLPVLHMGKRLDADHHPVLQFLENSAIFLYPYVSCFIILAIIGFLWNKRQQKNDETLKKKLTILLPAALIPPGIYLLLSACGGAIIGQWFSYFAYISGIIALLLWPWRCGRTEFKRLFIIAAGYIVLLLVITSIDVMVKPRLRIHSEPRDIVDAGESFWQRHSGGKPLKVVYGNRWLCGVMELYSASEPSTCDDDDKCTWELVREQARENGMLIIYEYDNKKKQPEKEKLPLLPDVDLKELRFETYLHRFTAANGKTRKITIWFCYLPPEKVLVKK